MKILHILPSVNPQGGGPMEGVRQRGMRLLEMGHQVEVVSLDDPQSTFIKGYGLPVHAIGPSKGSYRYNSRLVPWLMAHAREYDGIVVNGLWQYHSLGAWRALHKMKVPYYVFTHGMLDPWFKKAYPLKHLKKLFYWPWAEYRLLRDARAVLFTSEDERILARQSFSPYKVNEVVVSYGTNSPPTNSEELREEFFQAYPDLRGCRLFLFLSRIQEKKGCDLLIAAFSKVAKLDPNLCLVMAGPDQTGWVAKLKLQAEQLGVANRIIWPGMLSGNMKWGAFYASEVFILPSHQENFGIAVAEAMGCGLPVLISDKINIWREIESDGAGFVAGDTEEGTTENLKKWMALSADQRKLIGGNSRKSFEKRFTIDAMAVSLLDQLGNKDAG